MNTGIIANLKFLIPLPFYLVGLILAFMAFTGRIRPALIYLTFLFPLQNIVEKLQSFPLGKDLNDILILSMLIGWIFTALSKGKLLKPSPFNLLCFITIVYTYFTLWNGSFYLGLQLPFDIRDPRVQAWKNYCIFPLMFFITANNCNDKKHIKWMLISILLAMFLVNYYTIDQIKFGSGLASRTHINGTFVWTGVNEIAAFYATYTFVLIGLFFYSKEKKFKLTTLILTIANIYCIFFFFSRGAYAAFFVGLLFMAFIKKQWMLLPLFIIVFSWQTVLPTQVVERIKETKNEEGQLDLSNAKRLVMWQQSVDLFKRSPVFGSGYNIFPYLGFELGDTHNLHIKVLAEQGIIGLFILWITFFLAFISSWKLFKNAKDGLLKGLGFGFSACVVSMFIVNFFGDRWTHTPLGAYFWILLGLVQAGNWITAKEQNAV